MMAEKVCFGLYLSSIAVNLTLSLTIQSYWLEKSMQQQPRHLQQPSSTFIFWSTMTVEVLHYNIKYIATVVSDQSFTKSLIGILINITCRWFQTQP